MRLALVILLAISVFVLRAQTTQGLISGSVIDRDGEPIAGAEVTAESLETSTHVTGQTDKAGLFALPLLPPGKYRVQVSATGYQRQEIYELNLDVAAFLDLPFRLRLLKDVWETRQFQNLVLPQQGTILSFYGPDLDLTRTVNLPGVQAESGALETTLSEVVNPVDIQELPLSGRDVYTALVLQPGVTADTTTARGIGVSVDGQRPSSSNFLLDGLDNNNQLITGVQAVVAPEAVQEYRISTNNFSAEYGWTTGYIANAVTKAGTNQWHGLAYFNLMNDLLDANDFSRNAASLPRSALKQDQPGFQVGGPLVRDRLYESASFDFLRSRGLDTPVTFDLPSQEFLAQIASYPQTSQARQVLTEFPPPAVASGPSPTDINLVTATMSPPIELNRAVALERIDYLTHSGAHRLMGRLAISRLSRPDFIWSPYPQFSSALYESTSALGLALVSSLNPTLTNEIRGSISGNLTEFDRAHPEIPTLIVTGSDSNQVILPGSLAAYSYRDHSRDSELMDNLVWARGRHIVKFGGGMLFRHLDGYLTFGQAGEYLFGPFPLFTVDLPEEVYLGISRQTYSQNGTSISPDYERGYRVSQLYWFAQDSFRVTPRITLNYGIRYERPGVPINTGAAKDSIVTLGPGTNLGQELTGTQVVYPASGDEALFTAHRNDWGGRFGISYSPFSAGHTVLRGAFGVFYDEPFDNLWENVRNNNVLFAQFQPSQPVTYLEPVNQVLTAFGSPSLIDDNSSRLTLYQPYIRSPVAYIFFTGIQRRFGNLLFEADTRGAFGRGLITTDVVNRSYSVPGSNAFDSRLQPYLQQIYYRANQGDSDYNALTLLARYHARNAQFQIAYTWSHSIDNQSEPLNGDYFNLEFTSLITPAAGQSAFVQQFNSSADRGNSDFDQRQNLVFYGIWESPHTFGGTRTSTVVRNWRVSTLGAIRSGLPYSVYANTSAAAITSNLTANRANLIAPASANLDQPAPGGKILLNTAAFDSPGGTSLGNLGRNALTGPGFFSTDLSLSRSFSLPWLGESGQFTLRADAFNILNHANLGNPDPQLGSPKFGLATYGRQEASTGFPPLSPLVETARQVQIILRFQF